MPDVIHDRAESSSPEAPSRSELSALADRFSAMTPRFNFFFHWFSRRYLSHFDLDDETVSRLCDLERRGSVVYVMRYSSRLDYLLFNVLFLREGLRLASFANGIRFTMYRPLLEIVRTLLARKRGRPRAQEHEEDREYVRRLTGDGASFFLFLRTQRLRTFWRGLWKLRHRHDELDLIREVVQEAEQGGREVFVVPVSIFWRKGPRNPHRFLALDYGSLSRPSDFAKVSSFLLTYRSLSVKIGKPIELARYITEHNEDGVDRIARTVRRSILIYLYREEKIVEGPTLRSQQRVLQEILSDRGVRQAIEERAAQKGGSVEKAEREVAKLYREIAARMNSSLLAVAALLVGFLLKRLFSSIETKGLEKVAEYAKRHPLILVPSHRSYFDFVIISVLFYDHYLVPPHIAARENMAFGPFGWIFRLAGAYYLRRSFQDPLYKQVFRSYMAYLVREGFTQEFFIEGGRSRTGKTLAPRLGMLAWNLDAFLESPRRDLFFVPIALTYERLVEESGIVEELEGREKSPESTLALFQARKVLRRRFGSVHVHFGDPISLAEELGDRRERFESLVGSQDARPAEDLLSASQLEAPSHEIEEEKRKFTETLGRLLVERINWSVTVSATSVVATALMGTRNTGLRRSELIERAGQLVELLRLEDIQITSALRGDRGTFSESIQFMVRSGLIKIAEDPQDEVVYFEESHRRALDLYRNTIAHYFATASILARNLLRGASVKELEEDLALWHDIFQREFFVSPAQFCPEAAGLFLDHFVARGWLRHGEGGYRVEAEGLPILRCLETQTRGVVECYEAICRVVLASEGEFGTKAVFASALVVIHNARRLGLLARPEAANDTTFGNAIELLVDREILLPTTTTGSGSARNPSYARGEKWHRLAELHACLAEAAGAG